MNESPLGAAALAGTPHPIDRQHTAKALGFDRPMANSLDAVSDRDYVVEFLGAASLCAVHLSRLAEEIVIWCSAPFRFIALSDAFTTGSSIMPQKRNPDAAELIARQGRPDHGRLRGALHPAEGPAADLRQGHAGGQGAAVRRRRLDRALRRGDDRHDPRPQGQPRAHARRRLGRLLGGDRSCRLAGARRSACRSGRPITRPARWSARRRPRASISTSCRSRRCRRVEPRITRASTRC